MYQKEARTATLGGTLKGGVLFLTVANLLVKLLGFAYKVPLNAVLGDEMASVNAATALFALLYTATTAGIPGALSVSVSRARAVGDAARIKRLFDTTLSLLLFLGFVLSLLLLLFARPLSQGTGDSAGYLCTVAIAPALFFTAATSVLRGYFQGFSRLVPTAVSELLEAIGKAGFGVALAVLALKSFEKSSAVAAALAVFGITLGVMMGTLYLLLHYKRSGESLLLTLSPHSDAPSASRRDALRSVFIIALPITLSSALMSTSGLIDARMMRPLLTEYLGDAAMAKGLYSDYSTGALTLYNLPSVFITPIAAALIPYISGAAASGKNDRASSVTATAIKLSAIVSIPSALGLSAFSAPILAFLFRSDTDMAQNAGGSLSLLAFCVFFAAILTVSSAVLQARGRERLPIFSLGAGVLAKLLLISPLVRAFGTLGVPLSTVCFYFVAAVANLLFLTRFAEVRLRLFDAFLRPLLCALPTVVLARMSYAGLLLPLGADLALIVAVLWALLLYPSFLVLFRAVGREELVLLPLGKRLFGKRY